MNAIATVSGQRVVSPHLQNFLGPLGKVLVTQAINGKFVERELLKRSLQYMSKDAQVQILTFCPTERSFLC